MIIIVTGTPATGKTTIAKAVAKEKKMKYLDVKQIVKKICSDYDPKDECYEVDIEKLNNELIEEIDKGDDLVIDSHLSHYLPKRYVDLCVVVKCDLKELQRRMRERKYSEKKISDNLEAEAFDSCYEEAKEREHTIVVVNTTESETDKEIEKVIRAIS